MYSFSNFRCSIDKPNKSLLKIIIIIHIIHILSDDHLNEQIGHLKLK